VHVHALLDHGLRSRLVRKSVGSRLAFPGLCPGCPLRLPPGVLHQKVGHPWQDFRCTRKNASFHPQSSIRYFLWLRRSRPDPGRVPSENLDIAMAPDILAAMNWQPKPRCRRGFRPWAGMVWPKSIPSFWNCRWFDAQAMTNGTKPERFSLGSFFIVGFALCRIEQFMLVGLQLNCSWVRRAVCPVFAATRRAWTLREWPL
jgi:hypothetical protein